MGWESFFEGPNNLAPEAKEAKTVQTFDVLETSDINAILENVPLKPLSFAQTALYIFFKFAVFDTQVEQVLAWMYVRLRSKWISASTL